MLCCPSFIAMKLMHGRVVQVRQLEREIAHLKKSQSNGLQRFGRQFAVELAAAIKKSARQFHRKPVGPLGYHMTLSDGRYVSCLGSCVTCNVQSRMTTSGSALG